MSALSALLMFVLAGVTLATDGDGTEYAIYLVGGWLLLTLGDISKKLERR